MPVAQLNIRLDAALKQEGNAILSQRGQTPSQLVRAAWSYLVLHGTVPPSLEHLIDQDTLDNPPVEQSPKQLCDAGAKLVAGFYEQAGIPQPRTSFDYEALREYAAEERLREWSAS